MNTMPITRIRTLPLTLLLVLTALPGVAQRESDETKAPDSDLAPITIELPEAFFGGTPTPYWSAALEPEDYKKRPDFLAPKGTVVVSRGKPLTASTNEILVGELKQIKDGDKDFVKKSLVELGPGVQWVQIDLEKEHTLYAVLVWHFHEGKRVYFDLVVQASNDPEFKEGVTTLYNNDFDNSAGLGIGEDKEYVESNQGRLIDAKGVKARYLRLYGNGNTANDLNNYVEVEVFGLPG